MYVAVLSRSRISPRAGNCSGAFDSDDIRADLGRSCEYGLRSCTIIWTAVPLAEIKQATVAIIVCWAMDRTLD